MGSVGNLERIGRSCFEEANVKYTNIKMCSVSLITKEICIKELPLFVCHICIFIYLLFFLKIFKLYNIVLVFAIYQHESTTGIFIYFKNIYLFGHSESWLQPAGSLSFVVACRIFNYSMQSLICSLYNLVP